MCLSLPSAAVLLYGASSASAGSHYGARCWCTTMSQGVQLHRNFTGVGVCSPRPAGHSEFCKYLPDSLTGWVGLAANGAGPRRRTAGVTPASVRTRDRKTEARTGPCPLYTQWQITSELPRCDTTTTLWPPTRRPADGQQRAASRKRGHQEGSRGLTSPSRRAHLRRYCTVGAIRRCLPRTGREWTQRESPAPAWSTSTKERD